MQIHHILIIGASLLFAGCSKSASASKPSDALLASDMNTITNVIIKNGAIYKKVEAGEPGYSKTVSITMGDKPNQRHYLLSWNGAKWQVTQTNQ